MSFRLLRLSAWAGEAWWARFVVPTDGSLKDSITNGSKTANIVDNHDKSLRILDLWGGG